MLRAAAAASTNRVPLLRRMGASASAMRARAAGSPNYRDGQFRSHEPTHWVAAPEGEDLGHPAVAAYRARGRGRPVGAIPVVRPEWPSVAADLAVTWLGHATSLVELDGHRFLLENMQVQVATHEDAPLFVELPVTVELVVQHTDPGLQGDRSTGGTKPATLETGAEVQVPLFINTGDKLKVDSRDGSYLGRVNS